MFLPKKNLSKGSSHIFVLIGFFVFLGIAGFYVRQQSSQNGDVLATNTYTASVNSVQNVKKGFSVLVSSQNNSWDFFHYLCKTYSECIKSLDSGLPLSTVSGGQTESYEIYVQPTNDWSSYRYVKYYVKSGVSFDSGIYASAYAPKTIQKVQGLTIHNFKDIQVKAVIVPISSFLASHYNTTKFSDFE